MAVNQPKLKPSSRSQLKPSQFTLKPAEIRKLVHAAPTFRDRCLIRVLVSTGIRRSEAAGLDIRDVDFKRFRLHIRSGKGDKARVVPMPEELASDLRHLVGRQTTGPLFRSRLGGAISPRQVNLIVNKAGELAAVRHPNPAIEKINPHLLRHSFAHTWKKRGGSAESLKELMGHESIKTTADLYGVLTADDVDEIYRRIMDERE